jgi:hypothetical protein
MGDEAREHISSNRSGQLAMTPDEDYQANLVAQQGKGNYQRAADKIAAIPGQIAKYVGFGSAVPGVGSPMGEGIKKLVTDEAKKEWAMSPWERIKYAAKTPYNMDVAGGAAVLKSIPAMAETALDAARLADPYGIHMAMEQMAPGAAQKLEAAENTATDLATKYTNIPVNAAVKASGADTENLPAKVAEFADPLLAMGAIPMGPAAELEGGIAKLSSGLVEGAQTAKATGTAMAANAAKAAVPYAVPAAGAVGGIATGVAAGFHGLANALWEAGAGILLGRQSGIQKGIQTMLTTKLEDMSKAATIIADRPNGMTAIESLQGAAQSEIDTLQARIESLKSGLSEGDRAMLDKKAPDGSPLHPPSDLSANAKKIRDMDGQISTLQDSIDTFEKRKKFEQFKLDSQKYLTGLGINAGIGGGIGAGFAGATSPPGDTSQMGPSTLLGAGLGLAGGIFGVPKGMQAERATQNLAKMNEIGSKIAPQVEGISPDAQSEINKLAAVAAPVGYSVEVVSPEQYAQRPEIIAAKSPEESGVVMAPNGHVNQATKTIVLNRDALNSGVGWHELTHITQQLYGQTLANERPDLMEQFNRAYDAAAGLTGNIGKNFGISRERDAEVGRILLQQTPIENFYGGKRIFDTLDPSNIVNAIKGAFGKTQVDPTLQAPYSQADLNQMRGRMFQLGRDASEPAAEPPPLPAASLINQVDQAAAIKPKVVPAQAPTDAVDALVTMGQTRANAQAKVDAAMQDLQQSGEEPTLENVVKKALQRTIPKPEDVVSQVDQVAKTPTAPEAAQPPPVMQSGHPDYDSIRTDAENSKREELSGTKRKTKEAEISRAGVEAMAQAHATHVGDTDLVTWRTNRYGKPSISGRRLDPTDPFNAYLIDQANLSPEDTGKMNFLESNMGKTITADYLHAPEESEASGITRKAEQAASGAPERVAGEAPTRRLSKSFVPTGFTFNAPSKTFEVNGFSPDKFLKNAQVLIPWASDHGMQAWKNINDPQLVQDFQTKVANNSHGFTAMGKPIEGTATTPVRVDPDYTPVPIPKDRADLLNAMMGDTSARVSERKGAPYQEAAKADKQALAQQNSPYWEPQTGEVNRIRAMLGDNSKLLESTSETLRPELVDNLRTEPISDARTMRPSGFTGDRGAFASEGTPNSTFTASGFMPRTDQFEKFRDTMPKAIVGNFDPMTHKTISDLKYLGQHELDMFEEGQETDISNKRDANSVRGWMNSMPSDTGAEFMPRTKILRSMQFLTPEQKDTVADRFAGRIEDHFKTYSPEKGVNYALEGKVHKDWYPDTKMALDGLFGGDSNRSSALLASLSPQTDLRTNLLNALNVWGDWDAADRPTDKAEIRNIIGDNVLVRPDEVNALDAWVNNAHRSLSHDTADPGSLVLSGPKVNSFYQNLTGDLSGHATADRLMGYYAGKPRTPGQSGFSARTRTNAAGENIGIPGFDYLAHYAHLNEVAQKLNGIPGEEGWDVGHVQSSIWAVQRAIETKAKQLKITPDELLAAGGVTKEDIANVPSFASLLNEDEGIKTSINKLGSQKNTQPAEAGAAGQGEPPGGLARASVPNEPSLGKAQIDQFIKDRQKVYRNETDGFYEFQNETYRTKPEFAAAVRKFYSQPEAGLGRAQIGENPFMPATGKGSEKSEGGWWYQHAGRQTAKPLYSKEEWAARRADREANLPMVNIGLKTNDGGTITPEEAVGRLEKMGVPVIRQSVHQSGTEPTLVATLSGPLSKDEGHQLSVDLRQDAIPQYHNGQGEMLGQNAAKWGDFNPAYFLNHEGKPIAPEQGMSFMPSTHPRAISEAAVRDPDGKIYRGATHAIATDALSAKEMGAPTRSPGEYDIGFVTNDGEFLDRDQARERALEMGQMTQNQIDMMEAQQQRAYGNTSGLESKRLEAAQNPPAPTFSDQYMPATKPFYSQLERTIQNQPDKASPEQLRAAILKGPGVKQAELRETKDQLGTSFDQWLKDNPKATKSQMLDFVRENQVQVKEITRQDSDEFPDTDNPEAETVEGIVGTKFRQYQLPGAIPDSYRETLATLPSKEGLKIVPAEEGNDMFDVVDPRGRIRGTGDREWANTYLTEENQINRTGGNFTSSHFSEPNVVLHLRSNERESTGGKMHFLEELQSDWAQKGRAEGYGNKEVTKYVIRAKNRGSVFSTHDTLEEAQNSIPITDAPDVFYIDPQTRDVPGVPDMPFKGNAWKQLGLKIALRKAVEGGADELGWTTGEQQAARYDLSKQVRYIDYFKSEDGTFGFDAMSRGGMAEKIEQRGIKPEDLPGIVGKDVAARMMAGEGSRSSMSTKRKVLMGDDLKVGGHGMEGFYDKELVNIANDLVKKWGARVGTSKIKIGDEGEMKPGYDVEFVPSSEIIQTGNIKHSKPGSSTYNITLNGEPVETGLHGDELGKALTKYKLPVTETVHSLPITDAMRKSIGEEGQSMFMPATRAHLKNAAEKLGATVEDDSDGRWTVLQVVAPAGMIWRDSGGKHLKVEWPAGNKGSEPITDAINRIKVGLEPDAEGITDEGPMFMPSTHPNAITKAAVKDEYGNIFTGAVHAQAYQKAIDSGAQSPEEGFIDRNGKFLDREQAMERAKSIGQMPNNYYYPDLHSKDVNYKKFSLGGVVVPTLSRARVA